MIRVVPKMASISGNASPWSDRLWIRPNNVIQVLCCIGDLDESLRELELSSMGIDHCQKDFCSGSMCEQIAHKRVHKNVLVGR